METVKNTKQPELAGLQPQEATLISIETDSKYFKSLTVQEYNAVKETFSKVLNHLLGLLQKGELMITPSAESCRYCPYTDICRKGHEPTLRRAAVSYKVRELKTLIENSVPKTRGKNAAK